jgi:hypothetical protein
MSRWECSVCGKSSYGDVPILSKAGWMRVVADVDGMYNKTILCPDHVALAIRYPLLLIRDHGVAKELWELMKDAEYRRKELGETATNVTGHETDEGEK